MTRCRVDNEGNVPTPEDSHMSNASAGLIITEGASVSDAIGYNNTKLVTTQMSK
jgi:hypothetical protein